MSSAPENAADDASQDSVDDLGAELQRIDGNLNGAFAKMSRHDDRISELEAVIEDQQNTIAELRELIKLMGSSGNGASNSPDDRALEIRRWLYETAKDGSRGTAQVDKDVAKGIIGKLSREQRYEAMRRAAGGNDLAKNGTSDLDPVPGIEFEKYDGDRLNRVVIDIDEFDGIRPSKNITTEETSGGA